MSFIIIGLLLFCAVRVLRYLFSADDTSASPPSLHHDNDDTNDPGVIFEVIVRTDDDICPVPPHVNVNLSGVERITNNGSLHIDKLND